MEWIFVIWHETGWVTRRWKLECEGWFGEGEIIDDN